MIAPGRSRLAAGRYRAWLAMVCLCVVLVTAIEAFLFDRATSFLGAGYNSPRIDERTFAFAYLPGAMLLDLWLVLSILTVALPLLSRVTSSRLRIFGTVAFFAAGLPLATMGVRYNVYATLGKRFSVSLLSESSTLGSSGLVFELLGEAPMLLWAGLLILSGALVCWKLAAAAERRFGGLASLSAPPLRLLSLGVLASGAGSVLMLLLLNARPDASLRFGFEQKLSGRALSAFINRVTDFDVDGYGALARPGDPAPFDPRIHPYAVDVPGNGRDENGVAGDHPAQVEAADGHVAPVAFEARPHVLLVYLESFRHDLLGAQLNGREITPFLNRLAREGASSSRAYVHAPWTLASRMQLFTGSMLTTPPETTLVDDFKNRGYTVAWFSGQDDSYGDSAHLLGGERADVFYDARQDIARRTSRSLSAISLQVSWKTVTGRALDFLAGADGATPIFLYLNVVDTHYPYTHAEIDPMLGGANVERDAIRADRAREVFETYANTAANVDRAVQFVFEAFRWKVGDGNLAVVVTADHGQAFYEYGALGHGQTLSPIETRVPFIVWGLGGEWREPIAPTDVRAQLLRHLGSAGSGRAKFVPDPSHRILQYVAGIEAPRYIALRGVDDVLLYDFPGASALWMHGDDAGDAEVVPVESAAARELIWRWEALQRTVVEAEAHGTERVRSARTATHVGG